MLDHLSSPTASLEAAQIQCHALPDPMGMEPRALAWSTLPVAWDLACSKPDYYTTFSPACIYLKTECLSVTNVLFWFSISLPQKVLEQTSSSQQHRGGNAVTEGCGAIVAAGGESLPLHFPSPWPYFHTSAVLDYHVTSPKPGPQWNPPCSGSCSLSWHKCPALLRDGAGAKPYHAARVWQLNASHEQ